ncbi:beta-ketoacyl reductase [Nocardia terpenica]|uniref:Carrier domain-containing protein n=1 Tax=Nocardia terpenica TaxID=455432 RepID=A0A164N274_9NOCA|nr:acyl carrier protein [Nocardia terpenica]KZM73897.1 hypothetical protein AWN90_35805 [Nocardia terpenica]NQE86816.1 hypothetical protein [Nocardia terpenica]
MNGAANAFLDAFAVHRNRTGDRPDATTFAWAAWRGLGMAAGTVTELYNAEAEALGVADITAEQALRAWEFAVRHRVECCSVMRVLPLESGAPRLPLLSELSAAAVASGTPTRAPDSAPDWSALPPEQLHERLPDEVQAQFEAELGLPEGQLDVRRPLADTGLDSIMTVAIRAAWRPTSWYSPSICNSAAAWTLSARAWSSSPSAPVTSAPPWPPATSRPDWAARPSPSAACYASSALPY